MARSETRFLSFLFHEELEATDQTNLVHWRTTQINTKIFYWVRVSCDMGVRNMRGILSKHLGAEAKLIQNLFFHLGQLK